MLRAIGIVVGWAVFYTIDSRMLWVKEASHHR